MSWTPTRTSLAALVAVLVAFAGPAAAQKKTKEEKAAEKEAAAHYKQGRAYYDSGVYQKALDEFFAAYRLAPRPLLDYHIGRSFQGLGDRVQGQHHLRKFIEEAPDDKAVDDARARIAQMELELEQEARAAAEAQRKANEEAVAKHRVEAVRLEEAGDPDAAVVEYEAAWELAKDAELLFEAASVRKRQGDRAAAIAGYRRYLDEASGSSPSWEKAHAEIRALGRAIQEQLDVQDPQPAPDPVVAPPPQDKPKHGVRWGWVGGGAATLAVGVVADVVPDSGKNGVLDAMDFVPVGLYAIGAVAIALGIF